MIFRLNDIELAVGHCVIVNDYDQPSTRLIAVITQIGHDMIQCNYLNSDPLLSYYNRGLGMCFELTGNPCNVTPVNRFGVKVHYNTVTGRYFVSRDGESTATYKDGTTRPWQEHAIYSYVARRELARMAMPSELVAR